MSAEAYPLQWPEGWPRTLDGARESDSRFRGSAYGLAMGRARDQLIAELVRLGARDVVVSSNIELRRDGLPYSDQRRISDPGVAVYFTFKKRTMAMACDRFVSVAGNMRSLGLAIEGMRQLNRHGGGTMMERAFAGFAALPPPPSCWQVLGVEPGASEEAIRAAFKDKASQSGAGGNIDMGQLVKARDEAIGKAAA